MYKLFLLLLASLATAILPAQEDVMVWDFEDASLGDWGLGADGESAEISDEFAASGTYSVKLVASNSASNVDFQNDNFENMQSLDKYTVQVYVPAGAVAAINGLQLFWQDEGDSWAWNSQWFNGTDLQGDAWNELSFTVPEVITPLQRIGFQLTGLNAEDTPTIYIDDIKIQRSEGGGGPTLYTDWSFEDGALGDWGRGADGDTAYVTTDRASEGTYSVFVQSGSSSTGVEFQNDLYEDMRDDDVLSFDIFITAEDLALVNGFQVFWQDEGSAWAWNAQWFNASDVTPDEWHTLSHIIPEVVDTLQRIGVQLVALNAEDTPAFYVDNVQLLRDLSVKTIASALDLESENASLGFDWATETDGDVTYVTPMTNFLDGATSFPGTADKVKEYSVDFVAPGTYNLYVRVYVGEGQFDDDSFLAGNGFGAKDVMSADDLVVVNGLANLGYIGPDEVVMGAGNTGSETYKWINASAFADVQYVVPEGELEQIVQIGAREDGFRFDKIAFGHVDYEFTVATLDAGGEGDLVSSTFTPGQAEYISLKSVRPTPMSESAEVEFTLERSGRTMVDVLDINGNRVAVLADEFMSSGTHNLTWRPGAGLPNGHYLITLQNGNERVVQKAVLVR